MHPNICVMDQAASSTARPAWNDGAGEVHLHPSSICHPLEADKFLRPYLTYSEKVNKLHWPPTHADKQVQNELSCWERLPVGVQT